MSGSWAPNRTRVVAMAAGYRTFDCINLRLARARAVSLLPQCTQGRSPQIVPPSHTLVLDRRERVSCPQPPITQQLGSAIQLSEYLASLGLHLLITSLPRAPARGGGGKESSPPCIKQSPANMNLHATPSPYHLYATTAVLGDPVPAPTRNSLGSSDCAREDSPSTFLQTSKLDEPLLCHRGLAPDSAPPQTRTSLC